MIRLDMSEFMEKHNVSRLVGAPPGYVGYDDGGQLTDTVRRKSYCLILLDEIEKAHPDVFNMLLQVFDDGSLTDAKGRKVDFRNTIIIMTSNVGSDLIRRESGLGFDTEQDEAKTAEQQYQRMKDKVTEELKRVFRPEFLNRIDSPDRLPRAGQGAHPQHRRPAAAATWRKNLMLKGISMEVTDAARDWLGEKGYDPVFGARPAAPRHPERARGPALGGAARRPVRSRRHGTGGRRWRRDRPDQAGNAGARVELLVSEVRFRPSALKRLG